MKKGIVLFLKLFLLAVVLIVIYVLGSILHGTMTDFQPEEIINLELKTNAPLKTIEDSVLTFANWNVGYGGLGEESDFFYDNGGFLTSKGKMIRAPKNNVEKNIDGALAFIKNNPADFYLFQEVDVNSKRSYYINQMEKYQAILPNYSSTFSVNFRVKRVPLPVLEPWRVMGKMESGLGTFAKYQSTKATRYQFPGKYDWPTRIFQLDRCFAMHRYPTASGKELIVINTHNSAYDNGSLKKAQMKYLKDFLLSEYEKGNYVVVGGDWNQCPPHVPFDKFMKEQEDGRSYAQINIAADYVPEDWSWVFDESKPTNRKLTDPYIHGKTFVTLIDFYLVSPNLEILEVKGIDQAFKYSDHQPVMMKVKLK